LVESRFFGTEVVPVSESAFFEIVLRELFDGDVIDIELISEPVSEIIVWVFLFIVLVILRGVPMV